MLDSPSAPAGPVCTENRIRVDGATILDPKTNTVTFFKMPVADPNMPEMFGPPLHPNATLKPIDASAYWGEEKIWSQRANNHNGMFDSKGRVWFAAAVRGIENPAFCKKGSDHPSAKAFPLERSGRQVSMLDPKTMKYSFFALVRCGMRLAGLSARLREPLRVQTAGRLTGTLWAW